MIKNSILILIILNSYFSFINIDQSPQHNFNENPEFQVKLIFIQLKSIKDKKYNNQEEEDYRFQIFKNNIKKFLGSLEGLYDKYKIILVQNGDQVHKRLVIKGKNPCEYLMDLNKFVDMSEEEFASNYLLPKEFFDTEIYKPISKLLQTDEKKNSSIFEKLQQTLNDKNFNVFHEKLKYENANKKYPEYLTELQKFILDSLPSYDHPNQNEEIIDERLIDPECQNYQNSIKSQLEGRKLQYNNYYTQPYNYYQSYQNSYNTNNSNYFTNYYNTFTSSNPFQNNYRNQTPRSVTIEGVTIPTYLNWRSQRSFTPVKDQQSCNACYAFGAISAIEAHNALKYSNYQTFSEQEIMDCSSRNYACTGGQPFAVFDYIIQNGVSYDQDYPYQSRKNFCRRNQTRRRFRGLKGYYFTQNGILNLLKAVNTGPIVVVSYASDALKYQYNGIFDGRDCSSYQRPNHASLLYGYDLNAPIPYMMFKNNWGTFWGNAGYYKVAIGNLSNDNLGHCLIAQTPYNVMPVLQIILINQKR